jgi:hypothetical protein
MLPVRSTLPHFSVARDERIDDRLAQVKALNARIAELEAKLGGPPKTPDNSSLPPSRGQKASAKPSAVKLRRRGRPGVTLGRGVGSGAGVCRGMYRQRKRPRQPPEKPDATLLRPAIRGRLRIRRSRTGACEGVRSYRHSTDQADHDAHRVVRLALRVDTRALDVASPCAQGQPPSGVCRG